MSYSSVTEAERVLAGLASTVTTDEIRYQARECGALSFSAAAVRRMLAASPEGVLHVGKSGNDTVGQPFLTFGAAFAAASALSPAADNRMVIHCADAGVYTEAVIGVDYVDIDAPHATLTSAPDAGLGITVALALAQHSSVRLFAITSAIEGSFGVVKATAGPSFLNVQEVTMGANSVGLANISVNGQMLVEVRRLLVGAGSFAAGDATTAVGHMHLDAGDIYLAGDNAVGLIAITTGSIVTRFDHILETGTPSGTVGMSVNTTSGYLSAVGTQIKADTAAVFTAGQFNLVCPFVTGALTGLPAAGCTVVTDQLVYLPDADATFLHVTPET